MSTKFIEAAKTFTEVHNDWSSDQFRPATPDRPYLAALRELLGAYRGVTDIPGPCRRLHEAVGKLDAVAGEVLKETHAFWSAREAVEAALLAMEKRDLRPLESMLDLAVDGVQLEQIGRMYRLTDEYGNGRVDLVLHELCELGSVITDKWVDPRLGENGIATDDELAVIAKQKEMAKQLPEDDPKALFFAGFTIHSAAQKLNKPADEVDRLWSQFRRECGSGLYRALIAAGIEAPQAIDHVQAIGGLGLVPCTQQEQHEALSFVG